MVTQYIKIFFQKKLHLTFKRAPTIKNILALSHLKQQKPKSKDIPNASPQTKMAATDANRLDANVAQI